MAVWRKTHTHTHTDVKEAVTGALTVWLYRSGLVSITNTHTHAHTLKQKPTYHLHWQESSILQVFSRHLITNVNPGWNKVERNVCGSPPPPDSCDRIFMTTWDVFRLLFLWIRPTIKQRRFGPYSKIPATLFLFDSGPDGTFPKFKDLFHMSVWAKAKKTRNKNWLLSWCQQQLSVEK